MKRLRKLTKIIQNEFMISEARDTVLFRSEKNCLHSHKDTNLPRKVLVQLPLECLYTEELINCQP